MKRAIIYICIYICIYIINIYIVHETVLATFGKASAKQSSLICLQTRPMIHQGGGIASQENPLAEFGVLLGSCGQPTLTSVAALDGCCCTANGV